MVSNANNVYVPNSLFVGKSLSIGPFKIKNGGATDTIRTPSVLTIVSDAQNINISADTVRMPKYVEAPEIRSAQLTVSGDAIISNNLSVGGYMTIGTAKLISNGSYRDTLRTPKELALISDANLIKLEADTVRMTQLVEAGKITTSEGRIDTLSSKEVRTARLSVTGDIEALNGAVRSNEVRTQNINSVLISTDSLDVHGSMHIRDSIKIGNSIVLGGINQGGSDNSIYSNDGPLFVQYSNHDLYLGGWQNNVMIGFTPCTANPCIAILNEEPRRRLHIASYQDLTNSVASSNTEGIRVEKQLYTSLLTGLVQRSAWDIIPETPQTSQPRLEINSVTSNKTVMTLNEDGKVGIGISSPDAELHVRRQGSPSSSFSQSQGALFKIQQSSNTDWAAEIYNSGGYSKGLRILSDGGLPYPVLQVDEASTGNTRFVVLGDGNVGIGTTNPAAELHIAGGDNTPTLLIKPKSMVGGDLSQIQFTDPDGGTGTMSIQYKDDGSPDLAIIGGNVGIGTTTPSTELSVCGTISASTEVVVQSIPGCDYVFENTYKRISIEDREHYHTIYKRLWGMPPASEIEKNGWPIGESVAALTHNIEDQWLDFIDLNKIVRKQNEEIHELKTLYNNQNALIKTLMEKIEKMEK